MFFVRCRHADMCHNEDTRISFHFLFLIFHLLFSILYSIQYGVLYSEFLGED